MVKPQISRGLQLVSIKLRPWKGKVSEVRMFLDEDAELVKQAISVMRDSGNYKRRTILSIDIINPITVKL